MLEMYNYYVSRSLSLKHGQSQARALISAWIFSQF